MVFGHRSARRTEDSATHPQDLATEPLSALKARNGFDPEHIEDVIYGCVTPADEQFDELTTQGEGAERIAEQYGFTRDKDMTVDDIDLFEVNEAFASVICAWLEETSAQ